MLIGLYLKLILKNEEIKGIFTLYFYLHLHLVFNLNTNTSLTYVMQLPYDQSNHKENYGFFMVKPLS